MTSPTWPLGLYCERTSLGFWAEPLNTWSNLAFAVAALLAWRLWRARGGNDFASLWLICAIAAIACGSFAFHAAPSATTVALDVFPIQMFVLSAIFFACRRYLGASIPVSAGVVAAFLAASSATVAAIGPGAMAGGIGDAPPLLAMPALALAIRMRAARVAELSERLRSASWTILGASAIFAASLAFRTLDQPLCPIAPTGLHFLWHCLNAVVLHRLVVAQIAFGKAKSA